jgi:hypothetical protein
MFSFLPPVIPHRRKPVVEAVVQQSVKAPVLPTVLIARPKPAEQPATAAERSKAG